MIRPRNLVLLCVTACVLAAGAVAQEKKPQKIKDWGEVVDPDGDCKVLEAKGRVTITIPATNHDLNPTPRFNNLSAPRILQEVDGDFLLQVKVLAFPRPEKGTSTKIHSYVAAGLVIWQDSNNFVRLTRSANGDTGVLFASMEAFQEGRMAGDSGAGVPDQDLYLRVERVAAKTALSVSLDGEKWAPLRLPPMKLADRLKVGVVAINSTTKEFAPEFLDLKLLTQK